MHFLQLFFIVVVLIMTWGVFIESDTHAGFEVTPKRLAVAALLPLLLIGIIVFPALAMEPILQLLAPTVTLIMSVLAGWGNFGRIAGFILFMIAGVTTVMVVPPCFVFALLFWVSGAMTATLINELKAWFGKRLRRRKSQI